MAKSIVFATLLIVIPFIAVADSKPILKQRNESLAPDDLRVLWNHCDVIARVRITASSVIGIGGDPRFLPLVYTEHTATVLKTYKGDLGGDTRFLEAAGSLELDDKIIEVEDRAKALPVGAEYIVFLRRYQEGRLLLAFDRESAFKIEKGTIDPQGRGRYAFANRGVSVRQFLDAIDYVSRSRDSRK
jgi:hypothetical protein